MTTFGHSYPHARVLVGRYEAIRISPKKKKSYCSNIKEQFMSLKKQLLNFGYFEYLVLERSSCLKSYIQCSSSNLNKLDSESLAPTYDNFHPWSVGESTYTQCDLVEDPYSGVSNSEGQV